MFRVSKPTENQRRKASKMTAKQKEVRYNQVVRAYHAFQLPQTAATPILEHWVDGIKETFTAHETTTVSRLFLTLTARLVAQIAIFAAIGILWEPTTFAHCFIHPASETSCSRAEVLLAAYRVTIGIGIHSAITGVLVLSYVYIGRPLSTLLVCLFAIVANTVTKNNDWINIYAGLMGLWVIYLEVKQKKMEAANIVR